MAGVDTYEWLFVLAVIAVVMAVLLLAARWRRRRFDDIRPGNYSDTEDSTFDTELAELPGGVVRTVGYRDSSDVERMNDEIRARAEASKPRLSSFRAEPVQQQSLLLDDDLDDEESNDEFDELGEDQGEKVPLLLDPSEEHNQAAETAPVATSILEKPAQAQEPELKELEEQPLDQRVRAEPEKPATQSQPASEAVDKATAQPQEPGEIVIINLMTSADRPYEGAKLFKEVTELGMRHGDRQIFHYCGRQGDEVSQFSMANLLKPGYFDLDDLDSVRTHALCFFFELMPDRDNMKIYETMLSAINSIRDDMGGELHDENRSVFTIQTSEHCRNRIRDFQRRHLLARN